jgi:hypothetical protein
MDPTIITLIALGILVLVTVAFFSVFRGKGKVDIKTSLGSLKAEGENPPPATNLPSGVRIKDAVAGRDIRAHNTGPGGVDLEKVKAKGDIDASNSPGTPPPKA